MSNLCKISVLFREKLAQTTQKLVICHAKKDCLQLLVICDIHVPRFCDCRLQLHISDERERIVNASK